MNQTSPIRVAVVDDHRLLLGALSEWVRAYSAEISLELAVASWSELLAHKSFPVDVVLLDVDLKDQVPISLKLATLGSIGVRTLLMSTYSEPALVREALASGALGYVVKSEPVESIVAGIRAAAAGERYLSEELELALRSTSTAPKLSAQERRVMALYGAGETVKSVAAQLGISEETAKSYLKRIREKYRTAGVDVGTKVALRRRAISDGILLDSE